jgi:hypothetical protein
MWSWAAAIGAPDARLVKFTSCCQHPERSITALANRPAGAAVVSVIGLTERTPAIGTDGIEFPSLGHLAATPGEALDGIVDPVTEVLVDMSRSSRAGDGSRRAGRIAEPTDQPEAGEVV